MNAPMIEISAALQLMSWGLVFIVFLTFLALVWSVFVAYLVRREGRDSRREILESRERSELVLKEMREDSKRLQFYLFSKFGPADVT